MRVTGKLVRILAETGLFGKIIGAKLEIETDSSKKYRETVPFSREIDANYVGQMVVYFRNSWGRCTLQLQE